MDNVKDFAVNIDIDEEFKPRKKKPNSPDISQELTELYEMLRIEYVKLAIQLYRDGIPIYLLPNDFDDVKDLIYMDDDDVRAIDISFHYHIPVGSEQSERFLELLQPLTRYLTDPHMPEIDQEKLKMSIRSCYKKSVKRYPDLHKIAELAKNKKNAKNM